jgi:hypothetical protein
LITVINSVIASSKYRDQGIHPDHGRLRGCPFKITSDVTASMTRPNAVVMDDTMITGV